MFCYGCAYMTKIDTFLKKYYHLLDQPNILPEAKLKEIGREIWYCNFSGKLIHGLQQFNLNKKCPPAFNLVPQFDQYYLNGYHKFHVFSCGHAVIFVYYLGILVEYYTCQRYQIMDPDSIKLVLDKLLREFGTECPLCQGHVISRLDLYKISRQYVDAISRTPDTIPEPYLPYIKSECVAGDVIKLCDTNLVVYHQNSFLKIGRCWPAHLFWAYGYLNMLRSHVSVYSFDRIYLSNSLYVVQCNHTVKFMNEDQAEPEASLIKKKYDHIILGNCIKLKIKQNTCLVDTDLPVIFLNKLLQLELLSIINLTASEQLVFGSNRLLVRETNNHHHFINIHEL